jgi:hypothetical protein
VLGALLGLLALGAFARAANSARRSFDDARGWRAGAVARGIACALLLQMLVWRTALEPVAWTALACAAGAAVAPAAIARTREVAATGARRSRWVLIAVSLLLAVVGSIPLVALGLREQARSGTDADARRAARSAIDLQPGAPAVTALGSAYRTAEQDGADELRRRVDGDLRHDPDAILATLDLAERWHDEDLARAAQRRLRTLDGSTR